MERIRLRRVGWKDIALSSIDRKIVELEGIGRGVKRVRSNGIGWDDVDVIDTEVNGVDRKSVDWWGVDLIDIDADCRFHSICLNSIVSKESDSDGIGHWEKGIHLNGVGSRANDSGGRSSVRLH